MVILSTAYYLVYMCKGGVTYLCKMRYVRARVNSHSIWFAIGDGCPGNRNRGRASERTYEQPLLAHFNLTISTESPKYVGQFPNEKNEKNEKKFRL